jgi:hypothetical protein
MIRVGIYRKKDTVTHDRPQGHLYQFLLLTRNHYTGAQSVVYMPLRIEPEWAGTIRPCDIPRGDWDTKFEYIGEGLPTPVTGTTPLMDATAKEKRVP